MKLKTLTIQNFLSVESAKLCLADKGLVSIEGINEDKTGSDSNGCGKSSIINSILWCLYGAYAKDGSADDVVNSKAGKDCFVYSEWEESGRIYGISRFRKHRKFRNSIHVQLNGKDITKAGALAVQQQINEIMGADEMVFRASCFAQQENPLDIPSLTDTKLKALLEECLPLENLTPLHKKASERVWELENRAYKLKQEIDLKTWQIEHNRNELKEALTLRINYTKDTDAANDEIDKQIKLKNIQRGIALSNSNGAKFQEEIEELKNQLCEIPGRNYILASYEHNEAEKRVATIKSNLDSPTSYTCSECGQETKSREDVVEHLTAALKDAERNRDRLRDQAKVASENHVRRGAIQTKIDTLERQLSEADRNAEAADRLEAEISLLEGQKRPSGANPHQPTVERSRGHLRAAIEGHKTFKEELTGIEAKLEIAKAVQLTFSTKGLRYHILERIAPKLTADTNRYLNSLTDGAIQAIWSTVTRNASGDYKEKFSIEAQMEGRSNFGLLSGGEKRKVRLSCFFALQDLIASQATKNIELWIADEIDLALDPAGMERLMGVLAEKVKVKSTILVISHNQLREWIPNYAIVTRKSGVSSVSGYLNVD